MNPVLGELRSPCSICDEGVKVMQAKRSGGHLYTRCECGLNQSSGKKRQQWVWDNALWLDVKPTPPVNVDASKPSMVGESEPAPVVPDDDADFVPELEPEVELEPVRKRGRGFGAVLAAALAVAGVALVAGA